jgi:hypothetical protein
VPAIVSFSPAAGGESVVFFPLERSLDGGQCSIVKRVPCEIVNPRTSATTFPTEAIFGGTDARSGQAGAAVRNSLVVCGDERSPRGGATTTATAPDTVSPFLSTLRVLPYLLLYLALLL